jgi:Spy/CpxP family protein refolding chaperone
MGLSIPADARAKGGRVTASDSNNAADPFAAFFPQQLVFLARDRIALTQVQHDALRARVNSTQPRLEKLQSALKRESAALAALTSLERVDEAAILAQLDKLVDVEREAKQLQVGLGAMIQNLLTPEQKAKLRELIQNHEAVAKLEEELSKRVAAKVERITAGAQKWAETGRDPSVIAQAMEQKVRPMMDAGRIFEAEVELDRVLEQLDLDTK